MRRNRFVTGAERTDLSRKAMLRTGGLFCGREADEASREAAAASSRFAADFNAFVTGFSRFATSGSRIAAGLSRVAAGLRGFGPPAPARCAFSLRRNVCLA